MTEMSGLHRTIILTPGNNFEQKCIIESIKLRKKYFYRKIQNWYSKKSSLLKKNAFK